MDNLTLYRSKIVTPETAIQKVRSNSRIYLGGGAGVPQVLQRTLVEHFEEYRNVEVVSVLTFAGGEYLAPEYARSFSHRALFIGENSRAAVQRGHAKYVPVFLSEIPKLFCDGTLPLDVAVIQVSPPDEHGFCSFGVEVGVTKPAAECV